ncbi:MAG TPA: HlyD family efflux transporter periplasmic adaptor subunit [Bacillota bacterium]|nr:HlyD family efflux transporter periplasmic adaptor subunit [Bacillota bacterium]
MLSSLRNNWKLAAFMLGAVIIAGGGWYYSSQGKPASTQSTASVKVERGNIKVTVSATGAVEPLSTRKVLPKTSATITAINYTDGQQVSQGQLLAKLDSSSVEQEIAKAEAELRLAELDYNTSRQELGNKVVTAPLNGRVAILETANGQDIQKNALMLIIEDQSKVLVKIPFGQTEARSIKVGQQASVIVGSLNSTLNGTVTRLEQGGSSAEDGSQASVVTVQLPAKDSLTAGMEAVVTVHTPNGALTGAASGYTEWKNAVAVRAGASGTVRNLTVSEGNSVSAGQRLATIDQGSADNELQSREIKVQQARITLETLRKKLADYSVYAPVRGQLNLDDTQKLLQVGDEANPGQALASITSHQEMTVTVPVDEVDIAKVKVGQQAEITVDALPDKKYSGKVISVASQGTESNNVANFDVTVQVADPEGLKSMMTANVEILVAQKADVLLVPIEAVQGVQGRQFVIPAGNASQKESNSDTGNARTRRKRVETGLYNENFMEITSGLQEGELVEIPTTVKSGANGFRFPGMGGDRPPGQNSGNGNNSRDSSSGGNSGGSSGSRN